MLDFGFYNMDCMDGMKQFPDKYFDLAVVDPPYGDGEGNNGYADGKRFGETIRTGGTWAAKFGKKLFRGTLRRGKNTSKSFSVSHVIR